MSFQASRVVREDIVEASVFLFIQAGIAARGFPANMIGYKESFNTNLFESTIDKSWIAPGFHMNDGGHLWEIGSNLRRKVYTFEYWVIGLNAAQGKNLAHAVSEIVETQLIIPLLDITQPMPYPVIGSLESAENPASVTRAMAPDPLPWQQHLYTAHIPVLDFYYL